MDEMITKVEQADQRARSNTHQIKEIKEEFKDFKSEVKEELREIREENKAIYKIASSVEIIAERLGTIEEKVDKTSAAQERLEEKIQLRVEETEEKIAELRIAPAVKTANAISNFKVAIYTAVGTSAAVAIATAILKLAFGG